MEGNMLKNKITYILIALVAVVIVAGMFLASKDSILLIQNNTDVTISGLKIKYSNSPNDTKVPEILPKQIYKTKLILPENFTEGSIKIIYTDKQGENHEEYLSGYIEKGYKVKINVNIDKMENNGVLSINIK
jgi:hypothetical protein